MPCFVYIIGSAGRTYVGTLGFTPALEAHLSEEGHPAARGGGERVGRERWLTIRVRIVRGEGRRIEGLRLLPRAQVTEAPEGMAIETPEPAAAPGRPSAREETSPESAPPAPGPSSETPTAEGESPGGWRGALSSLASGAETMGNISSGRWVWDPITSGLANWEGQLDRIGEQEAAMEGVSLGEVLIVPVGLLFTVLTALVGLLDMLARLNPAALTLHGAATAARGITGEYGASDLRRDAELVGDQALDLLTLGLRQAVAHAREGWQEGNAFRVSQAVGEIALAILALVGVVRGVRGMSSSARMAAAVEAEAAAGAEAAATARPTTPSELGARPTEPARGAVERPTVHERGLGERPTEPGRGAGERATVPESELAQRPTEPGRGAGERATAPESELAQRPSEPGSRAPAARRGLRRIDDLAEARRLQEAYARGERSGGHVNHIDAAELQRHWESSGGRGPAPLAWVDEAGHAAFDTRRVGHAPEGIELQGGRRGASTELGQRPTEPGRGAGERATAPERGLGERPTEPGPGAAERPTVPERGLGERPTEPERGLPERPTEPGAGLAERPTEPRAEAPRPRRGGSDGMRVDPEGIIRDTAEAQAALEQAYRQGPHPHEAMNAQVYAAEWRAYGGAGDPPLAYRHQNGRVTFDMTRLAEPSPEAQAASRGRVLGEMEGGRGRAAVELGERPTEPRAGLAERPTEPRAEAPRPRRGGSEGMRVDPEGIIRDTAEAQAALEQAYRQGPHPHEAMNAQVYAAEWRAYGGAGDPPLAYRHQNGRVTFDMTRLAEPSPEAQAASRGRALGEMEAAREARIAAEQARLAAQPPRWARRIETPAEARVEIDALVDAGQRQRQRINIIMSEEAYQARWRAAGGEGPAPVAFVDQSGALRVNGPGLRGQ